MGRIAGVWAARGRAQGFLPRGNGLVRGWQSLDLVRAALFRSLLLALLLLPGGVRGIAAQERLVEFSAMPSGGGSEVTPRAGAPRRGATLRDLPFFDDFANPGSFPQAAFWREGGNVLLRRLGTVGNPTPGVASFDIARRDGSLPSLASSASLCMDTLESVGINFKKSDDTTVYLSFHYQPGGLGEVPAEGDSLCLDFYNVEAKRWFTVWRSHYSIREKALLEEYALPYLSKKSGQRRGENLSQRFHAVHLPLRGVDLLKPGFRFRFRGQSSVRIDVNTPGVASNARQWNLDLVYLDAARHWDDTSVLDVSAIGLSPLTVAGYSTVPMEALRHYANGQNGAPFQRVSLKYQNFTPVPMNVGSYFQIKDLQAPTPGRILQRGHEMVPPHGVQEVSRSIGEKGDFDWSVPLGRESLSVLVRGFIMLGDTPDRWPFRYNDTLEQRLEFRDAYSYDRGEPDLGYGIVGRGAERANVAVRFVPITPTAIRAVRIWYNPLVDPTSRKQQRLAIWADRGGIPGPLLYTQPFDPPTDNSQLGRFVEIPLDTVLDFSGPLFVGWRQSVNDFVNVGYEQQPATTPEIYYQTTGGWLRSELQGAILLRVVCGGQGRMPSGEVTPVAEMGMGSPMARIVPNPCEGHFRVEAQAAVASIEVYDAMGRLLKRFPVADGAALETECSVECDGTGLGVGLRVVRVLWRQREYSPRSLRLLMR